MSARAAATRQSPEYFSELGILAQNIPLRHWWKALSGFKLEVMDQKREKLSKLQYPRRFVPPAGADTTLQTKRQITRFGSPLLGAAGEAPEEAGRRILFLLWVLLTIAHSLGAVVCLLVIFNVVPGVSIFKPPFVRLTLYGVPFFLVIAYLTGLVVSYQYIKRILNWFIEQREPTLQDRRNVLRAPLNLMLVQVSLWLFGTVLFGILYGIVAPWIAPRIVITVLFGAIIMATICYLQVEFVLRPAAAVVLEKYGLPKRRVGRLMSRFVVVWMMGTAIPLLGLFVISVFNMVTNEFTTFELGRYVTVLVVVTLIYSAVLTFQLATYIDPPLDLVRHGMEEVAQGNLDTEIAVFDATELGELQNGFNNMVRELREQEHVKDLFSQHVGDKIAKQALLQKEGAKQVTQRDAAVFFIDIIGSTKLSLEYSSREVVDILNRFYTIVVEEVQKTGGLVNKFAGDAVLAIYNVPDDHPDPAGAALYCSRAIMHRVELEMPEIATAVGVSAGPVVAGSIGSKQRYEYTVIGDPVNVAARLSELAKLEPGRILASHRTVKAANPDEAQYWMINGAKVLRGHTEATVLACPEQHVVVPFEERNTD